MNSRDNHAEAILADPRWARIVARDRTADDQFWYAVSTTGVYCRPSCPSRGCNPNNVTIHATLADARRLAPWPETAAACDHLEAVLGEFEDDSELLIDLGMARRLAYYTGVTFRAYTFDFGQPLLGGGRYDGALLPLAAGFAIGLERLLSALPTARSDTSVPPVAVSLDDLAARRLRNAGYRVERALTSDVAELRAYARARGIPYLLAEGGLEPLTPDRPLLEELTAILGQGG